MIPTARFGRLRKCLGRALDPTSRAGSPCARWERPPLSNPTMHRPTPSPVTRVRIEARRADHPSHFSERRKGAIAGGTDYIDNTGLLIEGTLLRYNSTHLLARLPFVNQPRRQQNRKAVTGTIFTPGRPNTDGADAERNNRSIECLAPFYSVSSGMAGLLSGTTQ